VVGNVLCAQNPKRDIGDAHALDLARGWRALAIGVDQQRNEHSRVETRRACPAQATMLLQRGHVEFVDSVEHEPGQVILGKPVTHVDRQQHQLITQHGTV
jgi:hypothetical protein